MKKNVFVLEDDAIQCNRLEILLNKTFHELNVFISSNYTSAIKTFEENKPFAFFILDIDLGNNPEMKDGLDFARYIRSLPEYEFIPIIYISSVSNRLEEAFQTTHCYEFIKKPYFDENVINAVNKMLMMPEPTPPILKVKGPNDSRLRIIIKEINYIEVIGHDIIIHTYDNDYISKSESLKSVLSKLPSHFVQCHRSYIINTHRNIHYNLTDSSISMSGVNERIPVGRKYREVFKS